MKILYLQIVVGDVEPELRGPFSTEDERDAAARAHKDLDGDEDGIFWMDVTTDYTWVEGTIEPTPDISVQVEVGAYSNGFFEEHRFRNFYRHCGKTWDDTWSCKCNDECPVCHKEITPYKSEDL